MVEPPPPPPLPPDLQAEQEEAEALDARMAALKGRETHARAMIYEAQDKCASLLQGTEAQCKKMVDDAQKQVDAIQEEARKTGEQEGFAKGHAEGLEKGKEEAQGTIEEANAKAERTMRAAMESRKVYLSMAEADVTSIAMHVVEKVLPQHFIDVPQVILPLVKKALAKVKDQPSVTVNVAPNAYEMAVMAQPELQSSLEGRAMLQIHADESLKPGDCVLETPNGNVDARLQTQLELIRQSLQNVKI